MNSKIFIPKTCRVGFQHRDDTFTKRLAYVIYYDAKGILRKETSWQGWCHLPEHKGHRCGFQMCELDGIEPWDFENVPTSGFVLNKGVRRFNWSHFGSGRSMIRIYDPRGIEMEVTPDNLIGILMHTDCSHREIQGELVYAWHGTELMLLPCSSEEYQAAQNYTALQGTRLTAKELREGSAYVTKNEEQLVYVGKHLYYEIKDSYRDTVRRVGTKQHIFCDLDGKVFKPIRSVPNTISAAVNEHCHPEFSTWLANYLASAQSAAVAEWITKPIPDDEWNKEWETGEYHSHPSISAFVRVGDVFRRVTIQHSKFGRSSWRRSVLQGIVYDVGETVNKDGSTTYHSYGFEDSEYRPVTDRSIFMELWAKFDNGLIQKW